MIDPKLQAELRAKYNPDGSELRKLQLRMLEMLKYIDTICQKNNIKYWLSSGTCLGAVRHGGFIPWDDDVDIEMLEKDYKRFCKIMRKQPNSHYAFQTHKTDKNYYLTFGKIRDLNSFIEEDYGYDVKYKYRGCFVDIFPIVPSNSKRLFSIGYILSSKLLVANHFNRLWTEVFWKCANNLALPMLKYMSSIYNRGVYRHKIGSFFSKKRLLNDVKVTIQLPFEGYFLPVPANYHSYLSIIYGDYMKIPQIDNIHVHTSKFKLW